MAAPSWQTVHDRARGQIGYNGAGTEDSPLSKFGAWYGVNPAQWCAMFVSWCFAAAGGPLNIQTRKGFAACPSGTAHFQRQQQWHHPDETPRPGDLVFFDFEGQREAHHVGIVESATSPSNIVSIQGNTTDRNMGRTGNCCRRKVHTSKYVFGYARPVYGTPAIPLRPAKIGIEMQIIRADGHGPLVLAVGDRRTNINNAQRAELLRQGVPEINLTTDTALYDKLVGLLNA
jgi:hypothetical protein